VTAAAKSPLGERAPLSGRRFSRIENVILVETIGSTNDLAKTFVEAMLNDGSDLAPTVVAARVQTAGRGRAGRVWTTPPGESLALSLVTPLPEGMARLRIPVETGIVLARGLSRVFGVEVRLKWPNDLLVARRKLGGILVETRSTEDGAYAVTGVGLNVTASRSELDEAGLALATSLAAEGVDRSKLEWDDVVFDVVRLFDDALENPIDDLAAAFADVTEHTRGDRLVVKDGERTVEGDYRGVTADGLLKLGTPSGEETIVSGDVATF